MQVKWIGVRMETIIKKKKKKKKKKKFRWRVKGFGALILGLG